MTGDGYPDGDHLGYGVYGHRYLDDGDGYGGVVFGQGRRALAAANAMGREEFGPRWFRREPITALPSITAGRAVFVRDCGCTPSGHAEHADRDDCMDFCDNYGLPPCADDYAWIVEYHVEGVPVLEVRW